jgi:hypothetical protein
MAVDRTVDFLRGRALGLLLLCRWPIADSCGVAESLGIYGTATASLRLRLGSLAREGSILLWDGCNGG